MVLAHGQPLLLASADVHLALEASVLDADAALVAMTTWETSMIPGGIADGLINYDAVIVPSRYSAEPFDLAFAIEGPRVRVVPHCFDPQFWEHRTGWGADRLAPTTRFYTHGAWSERKNHLAVLRAYLHAFAGTDLPVALNIISQGADEIQVRSMTMRGALASGIPDVHVYLLPLSEDDLLHFHEASDCFVTATRGEGWGLSIFEAAVMGKTIIAPDAGGHVDFLKVDQFPDPDTGWQYSGWRPVGHQRVPCFAGQSSLILVGARVAGERSSLVPGMDCRQTWMEPDVLELADRMRAFHDQRSHGQVRIHRGDRAVLERRFGYEPVANKLASTLQEIIQS